MRDIKDSPTDEVNKIKDRSRNNYSAEIGSELGICFTSLDKLIEAYQEYAKLKGFSATMRVGHKGSDGARKYQIINYDRGRKSYTKRKTNMISCPAHLNIVRRERAWVISLIKNKYNHELIPNMSRLMAAHKNLSPSIKQNLIANDIVGIRPYKSVRLLKVQCGGP